MKLPTFVLFMMMVMFSPLAIDVFLPALPRMAAFYDAPLAMLQALVPLFVLCMGFGQLVAGPMADRFGRRPMALAGVLVYVVAAIGSALAPTVEVLWALRALQGFGTCAIVVAAYSGVRDRYNGPKLTAIYSYLNGVICVSPALAPLLGGILTEQFNWQANFWFMSIFGAVVGLLLWFGLPETRPADTQTEGKLISWQRYQPVLGNPQFQFYAGMVTLSFTVILAYVSFSTDVLMVQMQQSPMAFALWFGSNAAINIVGAFVAPTLISKLGRRNGLLFGCCACVLAAIALLLMQHSSHPLAFMAPVYLAAMGFCVLLAVGTGAAMAPFAERAGTASALMGLLQMSGAAVLVGVVSVLGVSSMVALAITMILPALWWLAFRLRGGYRQVRLDLASQPQV